MAWLKREGAKPILDAVRFPDARYHIPTIPQKPGFSKAYVNHCRSEHGGVHVMAITEWATIGFRGLNQSNPSKPYSPTATREAQGRCYG